MVSVEFPITCKFNFILLVLLSVHCPRRHITFRCVTVCYCLFFRVNKSQLNGYNLFCKETSALDGWFGFDTFLFDHLGVTKLGYINQGHSTTVSS